MSGEELPGFGVFITIRVTEGGIATAIEAEFEAPLAVSGVAGISLAETVADVVVDLAIVDETAVPVVGASCGISVSIDLVPVVSHRLVKIRGGGEDVVVRNRGHRFRRVSVGSSKNRAGVGLVIRDPVVNEVGKVQGRVIGVGNLDVCATGVRGGDTRAHENPVRLSGHRCGVDVVAGEGIVT